MNKRNLYRVYSGSFYNFTVSILFFTVLCVSEAGVLVKTYVEKGMLVPDHVMTRLMLPRLEQLNRHSWLLDGKKNSVSLFLMQLECMVSTY